MTSRERIVSAVEHKPVDRLPIDFGGTGTTGINAVVYRDARRILGLPETTIVVREVLSQLAEIEPDMLEALGADCVVLWRQTPCLGLPVTGFCEGTLTDGTPCLLPNNFALRKNAKGDLVYHKVPHRDLVHPYKKSVGQDEYDKGAAVAVCPAGSNAFCRVYHPLKGVDTVQKLREFAYPIIDAEELAYLAHEAKRLFETTDKAVCGVFNGNIFELGQLYFGYEEFFVNLMLEPELIDEYFETRIELMMEDLKNYLKAVGAYIQVIEFTEDLGTQSSLLISPEIYRQKIKPLHRRMFDCIKAQTPGVKILLHSCGAVSELIPDFIELGVDALNPVQITAEGMQPEKLAREFGKDICFWGGGVDTQRTLNAATPQQVAVEARKNIEAFFNGTGYIFSQVHNVESSVPAENLVAAFKTAKEYKQ